MLQTNNLMMALGTLLGLAAMGAVVWYLLSRIGAKSSSNPWRGQAPEMPGRYMV